MTKFLDERLGEIFKTPERREYDAFFNQALKDFQSLGFIKIKKEGIEILDREGLENYLKDFGKLKN